MARGSLATLVGVDYRARRTSYALLQTLPHRIGMRLYLPGEWASDTRRRQAAGVPEHVVFKRKWEIGLELISETLNAGLPHHVVLADAGYGDSTEFRDGLAALGCNYVVGVSSIRMVSFGVPLCRAHTQIREVAGLCATLAIGTVKLAVIQCLGDL